jgi:hypothetical protein
MILIVSQNDDRDAIRMSAKLRARGNSCLCFDPGDFPSKVAISFSMDGQGPRVRLRCGAHAIDCADVRVVWFRHPARPRASMQIEDRMQRKAVEDESKIFLENLWSTLTCHWLPGPRHVMYEAEYKLLQLAMAQALGFATPPTLATNDPQAFMSFYRAQSNSVVSKLIGASLQRNLPDWRRYTEKVQVADLIDHRSVSLAPVIFQQNLAKQVEIRVTVVGKRVFAAEIHSQSTRRTRQDWRRYNLERTPHFKHTLPPDLADRCAALVERLGLRYGAIDLVLAPDGQYTFLEINPSGQWEWIEAMTGLAIDDAVCDLLCELDSVHEARPSFPSVRMECLP